MALAAESELAALFITAITAQERACCDAFYLSSPLSLLSGHLCLHLHDDSVNKDDHGDRQHHHTNIRSREEVGHHNPISTEQQHQTKTNNATTTAPADSYARSATAVLPLHKQRQQQRQHTGCVGSSGSSSSSNGSLSCPALFYISTLTALTPQHLHTYLHCAKRQCQY